MHNYVNTCTHMRAITHTLIFIQIIHTHQQGTGSVLCTSGGNSTAGPDFKCTVAGYKLNTARIPNTCDFVGCDPSRNQQRSNDTCVCAPGLLFVHTVSSAFAIAWVFARIVFWCVCMCVCNCNKRERARVRVCV